MSFSPKLFVPTKKDSNSICPFTTKQGTPGKQTTKIFQINLKCNYIIFFIFFDKARKMLTDYVKTWVNHKYNWNASYTSNKSTFKTQWETKAYIYVLPSFNFIFCYIFSPPPHVCVCAAHVSRRQRIGPSYRCERSNWSSQP